MIIRLCEFCKNIIKTRFVLKCFCDKNCQRKAYNSRKDIKEKNKIRTRNYRKNHPEWKERHRILAITRHKEKRAEYGKEYFKRPGVRAKIRKNEKLRRQTDINFLIRNRLRRSLNHALTKYSKTGKIMSSKNYGIDWKEIIESLKPFPIDLKKFEIDHIIPMHTFDLTNPEEVKKAFSPSNLQWLTIKENREKSGKIVMGNLIKNY